MDRDGTISEEVAYVDRVDRFAIYPWTPLAIRKLNLAGIKTVVITNQSGVARGLFAESTVEEVHAKLREELSRAGAFLDGIYYCPHHPEGLVKEYRIQCDCRKPATGLLHRAARDLHIDLSASYVIGDKYSDVELAFAAGARGILVLSGYGKGEWECNRDVWQRQPHWVACNLGDAVDLILNETKGQPRRTPLS